MQPLSRRQVLVTSAGIAGAALSVAALSGCENRPGESATGSAGAGGEGSGAGNILGDSIIPFDGEHQAGIATPATAHLNLVGFSLREGASAREVRNLMRLWTADARNLCTANNPLGSLEPELTSDPANLTITCGWGEGLFKAAGVDKPTWLGDVKAFSKDRLDPKWGQTDVVLQICSDDPLTCAFAMRHMVRSGKDYADVQWVQQGFLNAPGAHGRVAAGADAGETSRTPRNLFGQVDGTVNPRSAEDFGEQVWIADGAFAGGTAMVVRRIRMNLDTWEELDRASREHSIGRDLAQGAPLSGGDEFTPADLNKRDKFGLPVIDPKSHMALSMPPKDKPEQRLLRRPYNFNEAPDPATPKQLSNAGLVFICFQRNPRTQFEPIQQRLDEGDILNTWIEHVGSAMYFVPAGTSSDSFWGASLLAG